MRYVILQIWLWLYMTTAKISATYTAKFSHFLERKNQQIAGRILQRKQAAARGTAQAARDKAPLEMPLPLWGGGDTRQRKNGSTAQAATA